MSAYCFHKKNRLRYSWEYQKLFNHSQVFRSPECVFFRIQNVLGHYRLGITIKAKGSSVERNRVKRQLREFFRHHPHLFGDYDYNIVIPRSKKITPQYLSHLKESLIRQFHELH